jgi:hypothetical protein
MSGSEGCRVGRKDVVIELIEKDWSWMDGIHGSIKTPSQPSPIR